jgi:peptidoglycan/LPS O-acetylase OafA/YrhL
VIRKSSGTIAPVRSPPSTRIFAGLGALLLVAAAVLAILGSFAYLAAASVGTFFVAAALIARAAPSTAARAPAILALAAVALIVFGLTATPFFYAGWGLFAGAIVLALMNFSRAPRSGSESNER